MLKGLGALAGLGDIGKMMKTAQEMQGKMAELQVILARTIVVGEAEAGRVKVRATAKGEITGLDIDPGLMTMQDKEAFEDLILAAIRDAQGRAAALSAQEMARLAQEAGLPDMKLPL